MQYFYNKKGELYVPLVLRLCSCYLFATVVDFQATTAKEQCAHQNQAGWIDAQAKVSHFATTATQKQQDEQNPCVVATTARCGAFATIWAWAVIKQSVEHIIPPYFLLVYKIWLHLGQR